MRKLGYGDDTDSYRTIVGKVYHEAIAGEYPNFTINYSKIKIADGELELAAGIEFEFDESKNCVLFKLNETHFWVYFSSHTLQMNSESLYIK